MSPPLSEGPSDGSFGSLEDLADTLGAREEQQPNLAPSLSPPLEQHQQQLATHPRQLLAHPHTIKETDSSGIPRRLVNPHSSGVQEGKLLFPNQVQPVRLREGVEENQKTKEKATHTAGNKPVLFTSRQEEHSNRERVFSLPPSSSHSPQLEKSYAHQLVRSWVKHQKQRCVCVLLYVCCVCVCVCACVLCVCVRVCCVCVCV